MRARLNEDARKRPSRLLSILERICMEEDVSGRGGVWKKMCLEEDVS